MPRFRLHLSFSYDTWVDVTAPDAAAITATPLETLLDLTDLGVDTVEDLTASPIDWALDAIEPLPDVSNA